MNSTVLIIAGLFIFFLLLVRVTLQQKSSNSSRRVRRDKGSHSGNMSFSLAGAAGRGSVSGPLITGPLRPLIDSKSRDALQAETSPRVIMGSDYLQNGRLSHLQSFREGREGEERIVQQICKSLDSRWTIFRNLDLPDKDGDIDILLVGPGGIFAVEVKAYTGNFRVENGRYYKETAAGYMAKMQYGPGAQARKNARRLCNYLKAHGILKNNSVTPVVALAKDVPIELISTATVIWTQDAMEKRVFELNSRLYMSPEQAERIVCLLAAIQPTIHGRVH